MDNEEEYDLRLDELCLPTPSSQLGRDDQWKALLNAYRRVAGVPCEADCNAESDPNGSSASLTIVAESSVVRFSDEIDNSGNNAEDKSLHMDKSIKSGLCDSSTICTRTAFEEGFEIKSEVVMVKGKAGTGKSFLVRKLEGMIAAGADMNQFTPAVDDDAATGCSTLPSLSAGSKNSRRGSDKSLQSLNFAELPYGIFAKGSFTHGSSNAATPYSAFTMAFDNIMEHLLTDPGVDPFSLKSAIADAVGSDLDVLAAIVPSLRDVVDEDEEGLPAKDDFLKSQQTQSLLTADSGTGLRFIFRSFVERLCTFVGHYYGGPLVLFLDDAECIDSASAALLSALTTEAASHNLLVVLGVRSEMYEEDHMLRKTIKAIEEAELVRYLEIELGDLTKEQVDFMVAQAIRKQHSDPKSVLPLSDLVYQRTLGNSLFVVEFLGLLVDQSLLEFNLNILQWTWNIDKIQAETSVSDNVVDLVSGKIKALSSETRFVLVLASCLHSTVELGVLSSLVRSYADFESVSSDTWVTDREMALKAVDCPEAAGEIDVLAILNDLAACGLMERLSSRKADGSNVFKFAHERIRRAAQGIIPEDPSGHMVHIRVGELLREMVMASQAQTWMLFACLDHLNQGRESIEDTRQLDLVDLNLLTGQKAAGLSAFLPASKYYRAGLELLGGMTTLGEHERELQHQMRTQLAISLYRSGDLDGSEQEAKSIIATEVPIKEKLSMYYNLIAVYKAQGKLEDAVNIGMELLKSVGEKFTKKPSKLRLQLETRKVQKLLKKYTDEQLTDLPTCSNELKGAAVNVYAVLFGPMFHLGCPGAVDLLRLRSIYLTIKYGFSSASALAFAYYGSHLISQGDIANGYRFGKMSQLLLKKTDTEELTARTTLVANFLILHWKDPLSQTLDRLMKGYSIGMKNGDIEMAFTCSGLYQAHYYYCGLTLTTGEKDLCSYIKQMREYGQKKELSQYLPLWQMMLNLMGKSKNPTLMTGDAMDQTEFEQGKLGVVVMKSYRMQLAYYFDELELAQDLMDDLRPHSNSFVAPFFQVARRFFFALIRIGMARKAPVNQRAKLLKKINKEDVQWLAKRVSAGGINCLHKLYILKAEMATFDESRDEIKKAFEKAIMTSSRSGFSQDDALANELAASYFLSVGDFPTASDFLTRAHELYTEWGATGKVKQLERKYVLIKGGSGGDAARRTSRNKSHKGRQRFSKRMSECHKSVDSSAQLSILSDDEKTTCNTSTHSLGGELEKKIPVLSSAA